MEEEIQAVSVKLPGFWPSNPRAWFLQAEAQFNIRNITAEDIKYSYVVAALDKEVAASCISILERTPGTDKYKYLKQQLILRFELSEDERADRLLNIRELGDRRPSELADIILELNGSQPTHFVLRRIFMRALPLPLRNALSTSATTDLRELAREADRALATTGHREAPVYNVVPMQDTPEADAVSFKRRQLCQYHRKWGTRARRCQQPCDWTPTPPRLPSGNAQGGLR